MERKTMYIYAYADKLFIYPTLALQEGDFKTVHDFENEIVLDQQDINKAYGFVLDFFLNPIRRVKEFGDYYAKILKDSEYYSIYKRGNIVNPKLKAALELESKVKSLDDPVNVIEIISDRRLNSKYIYGFHSIKDIDLRNKEDFLSSLKEALNISLEQWESDPDYQKRLQKRKNKSKS